MRYALRCKVKREQEIFLECEDACILNLKQNKLFFEKLRSFLNSVLKDSVDTSLLLTNLEKRAVS